jgi:catechol 2,3-dioxygenase-like lactoylglutathione lyase family enzyme
MKIVNHRIPISKYQESKDFYKRIGFEVVFESEEYGWISLRHGELQIGLYVSGKGGGHRLMGGNVDYAFLTEDLERMHNQFEKDQIETSEIIKSNDGISLFDVIDPNGNILTFQD